MSDYDVAALQARWGSSLRYHPELGSTNAEALSLALAGAPHSTIVLAERQTQGRGRRGASWFCGEGKGLAFSLLVRPDCARALWPRLSLVAGLAVAQAIEKVGVSAEIKWPNDVLIAGKKVCGILVEAESDGVVIGVGLNVCSASLPPELAEVATALEDEGAHDLSREYFLNEITELILALLPQLDVRFEDLLVSLRSRCALRGKKITFLVGETERCGHCEGIGGGGELLVREDGEVRRFFAADQIRVIG